MSKNDVKGSRRLNEIVSVLRKHDIMHGLTPVKLRRILEDLGPTYVKFGQIMSMRSDMLPVEYTKELEKLRTEVAPLDYSVIKQAIEEELQQPIDEVFESISSEPLGSASIAQVHRAVLLNGDKVVIKVQRPHIYEVMEADIMLLRRACKFFKFAAGTGELVDFREVINELWRTSQMEMNFNQEAENIEKFAAFQKDVKYVIVPEVYREYTTRQILVMSDVGSLQVDHYEHLKEEGYVMKEIARKVADNFCKQILDDGFFHADPHPGNIYINNGKIAWVDFGMMSSITSDTQNVIFQAVQAILNDDIYELEQAFLMLVNPEDEIDHVRLISQLTTIVEQYKKKNFGDFDMAPLIEGCFNIIRTNNISVPADLTMLCRSMITMEGTIGKICPEVNLMEILANHMRNKMDEDLDVKTKTLQLLQMIYASTKKGVSLPSYAYDVLKLVKNGHVNTNLQANIDHHSLHVIRDGVNKLVYAILIFGLMVSGSLLTLSNLPKVVFDMPVLTVVSYVCAFILFIHLLKIIIKRK